MSEQWRAIPGFEGAYEVSDQGRVRSLDRYVEMRSGDKSYPVWRSGRVLRPGFASNGYPTVSLCGQTHCVHELVLVAFVGPRPPGQLCRHLDGDRANSKLWNLCWGTPIENADDAARHGTKVIGERYPTAKLNDDAAREILRLRGKVSQSRLAERFGVSPAAVQAVHDRRTWKHV